MSQSPISDRRSIFGYRQIAACSARFVLLAAFAVSVLTYSSIVAADEDFLEPYSTVNWPPHGGSVEIDEEERRTQIEKALQELTDSDPMIRRAGAGLLRGYGGVAYAQPVANLLADVDPGVRRHAATVLADMSAHGYTASIAALLEDQDPGVRADAISALRRLGAREQAPAIAGLLEDGTESTPLSGYPPKVFVNVRAIYALAVLAGHEYVDQIASRLRDSNPKARYMAVWALEKLGAKEHADQVATRLTDADATVRAMAVEALGRFGAQNHTEAIGALLGDNDQMVQYETVKALARLRAVEYAPQIAVLVKRREPAIPFKRISVRAIAIQALGKLGAKKYAGLIKSFLTSQDDLCRQAAKRVLEDWERNSDSDTEEGRVRLSAEGFPEGWSLEREVYPPER